MAKIYVDVTVRYTRECEPGEEALAQSKLKESIAYFKAQAMMRPMVSENLRIDVTNVTEPVVA